MQSCQDGPKAPSKDRSGWFPNCWNDPPTHYHMKSHSQWKLTTSYSMAAPLCDGPYFWSVPLWIWANPSVTYHCVSLSFCNETSRAWASLTPEAKHHGFWPGSSPRGQELKDGRKKQWENMPRNPLHNLQKICWIPDLCSQFSLAWFLAQRRLRTEELPLTWETATK